MSSTNGPYALARPPDARLCHVATTSDPVTYRERLGVPFRWWVQGTMLVATLWLALVVATPGSGRLAGHRSRACC